MRAGHVFLQWMNILGSFVFAVYSYLVLWGSINIFAVEIPAISPEQLTFSMGILMIGLPGMAHVLFEVIGPLVRAPGNVFLYVCSVFTSLLSIGVVGFAYLLWPFGSYSPTIFQWGALVIWGPAVLAELIVLGVSARLLQRSWFGEGAPHEGHR